MFTIEQFVAHHEKLGVWGPGDALGPAAGLQPTENGVLGRFSQSSLSGMLKRPLRPAQSEAHDACRLCLPVHHCGHGGTVGGNCHVGCAGEHRSAQPAHGRGDHLRVVLGGTGGGGQAGHLSIKSVIMMQAQGGKGAGAGGCVWGGGGRRHYTPMEQMLCATSAASLKANNIEWLHVVVQMAPDSKAVCTVYCWWNARLQYRSWSHLRDL